MRTYSESSIRVLKGLEPVRARPGMYTRTDSPTHIIQEVIDNAADEALAGHAKRITVTVHLDGSVSVEDDGRGIPVGPHPTEKDPTVVVVYTRLHAGGKFDKTSGESAYSFSGGLHGVGVSVTNALSKRLDVTVKRDGKVYEVGFGNGGNVTRPLTAAGETDETGTCVRVWPDPVFFDSPRVSVSALERLLKAKALLLGGVCVRLLVEREDGGADEKTWAYPGGLRQYMEQELPCDPIVPIVAGGHYATETDVIANSVALGEGAQWAIAWVEGGALSESFVNLIHTPHGGTHESGLRTAVFDAVRSFAEHHGLLPRGVQLRQEDVCGRLSFVLSVRMIDPQFQGQTKERVTSREAAKLVYWASRHILESWFNANVDHGRVIAEMAARAASARLKSAQKVEKRKSSGVAVLPGKLSDAASSDPSSREIFLVEGDSAGGSAKMARDRETQAILPLRGKVLNTWDVEPDRIYANSEVHDIAVALGVERHGADEDADLSGLRYHRVIIMTDADVDGAHISTLLLTLFWRHFPGLVKRGHVWIARPPLFRVDVPARGKRPGRRLYALDEAELDAIRQRLAGEGIDPDDIEIGRFKGLGEMNPEQLRETAMHPDTRRLVQVRLPQDMEDVDRMFSLLMGKGAAAERRAWMEAKGDLAEVDA